jgi:hypothetical protein
MYIFCNESFESDNLGKGGNDILTYGEKECMRQKIDSGITVP